jgi:hypothetical protein
MSERKVLRASVVGTNEMLWKNFIGKGEVDIYISYTFSLSLTIFETINTSTPNDL